MSLPFDVTIFKRCPKSRQVHARINPLDSNATRGDSTRRPESEQGLPGKDQAWEIGEESSGFLRQKNDCQSVFAEPFGTMLVRYSTFREFSKRRSDLLR